jgi:hypothetical protein
MVVWLQADVTLASATMGCYMGCAKGNLWGVLEIGKRHELALHAVPRRLT